MKTLLHIIENSDHARLIAGSLAESKYLVDYQPDDQERLIERYVVRMLLKYKPAQRYSLVKLLLMKCDYMSLTEMIERRIQFANLDKETRTDMLTLKLFLEKTTPAAWKRISPGIN